MNFNSAIAVIAGATKSATVPQMPSSRNRLPTSLSIGAAAAAASPYVLCGMEERRRGALD